MDKFDFKDYMQKNYVCRSALQLQPPKGYRFPLNKGWADAMIAYMKYIDSSLVLSDKDNDVIVLEQ